jgi:hypothetical protein
MRILTRNCCISDRIPLEYYLEYILSSDTIAAFQEVPVMIANTLQEIAPDNVELQVYRSKIRDHSKCCGAKVSGKCKRYTTSERIDPEKRMVLVWSTDISRNVVQWRPDRSSLRGCEMGTRCSKWVYLTTRWGNVAVTNVHFQVPRSGKDIHPKTVKWMKCLVNEAIELESLGYFPVILGDFNTDPEFLDLGHRLTFGDTSKYTNICKDTGKRYCIDHIATLGRTKRVNSWGPFRYGLDHRRVESDVWIPLRFNKSHWN